MRSLRIAFAAFAFGAAGLIFADTAEAKKTATYQSEPVIKDCGIAEMDTVFKEAAGIQTSLDSAYKTVSDARTNVNSTMGVATDSPFSTAIADLASKAGGKLSVAMEGTMPKLKASEAVPDNVQKGLDAVNKLVDAGKTASDTAVGLKDKVTSLGKTMAAFPLKVPTMLGSLTADQVKTAPSIVGDNVKAGKNLATNITVITDEVTSIFTDITNAFKSK